MSVPAIQASCPYCGEPIELLVDDGGQACTYVEDCSVCCQPIEVSVEVGTGGDPQVSVATGDE